MLLLNLVQFVISVVTTSVNLYFLINRVPVNLLCNTSTKFKIVYVPRKLKGILGLFFWPLCKCNSPAKWWCHTVTTGSLLCCDRFDQGSRQVKHEPVSLVMEDYDVSLHQGIAVTSILSITYGGWVIVPPDWSMEIAIIMYLQKQKWKCRWFIVHYPPPSLPRLVIPHGLSTLYRAHTIGSNHWVWITTWTPRGSKGLLQQTTFWRNPSLSNSHPHRICNYRTLSSRLNVNDQYSQKIHSPRPYQLS